ncbi:hypothetical protein [Nitrospira moscoviensis]|uniref:Uncharacterized protein n=1 Tax=Nitrospira moscoviensis TaxID=42253 RepID=A0A0K2G868_NITMO|nr:hypothetical protein [Nitrospira moscoviensis]ALA57049.1 conserved exported protein of unknown function [Nitrospira moscoviensis]
MRHSRSCPQYLPAVILLAAGPWLGVLTHALAKDFNPDNPLNAPARVYWCPGKTPDQQITTKKSATCQPLHDERAEESFRERAREQGIDLPDRDPIKIVDLQNAASKFADRYRTFVSCCATDSDAKREIVDLIDEANHVLKAVQQKGIFNSAGFGIGSGSSGLGGGPGQSPKLGTFARQFTLSEIVGTVARARDDLFVLKERLERLDEAQQSLSQADYETSGRLRLQIQEEEETIKKQFKAKKPPSSAPTGMEIQDTTLRPRIGGDIEDTKLNSNFGADIGYSVSPYSTVGESLRPRRGEAIQDSQIPSRPGPEAQDTSIRNSTGFEIDRAQNPDGSTAVPHRGIGPSIGDSDFNSRRR